jgi:predicted RNA-binding protein associated with RNAse of E/G family
MDHALDVVIEPDGKWHWKDEDDFVEAQRLGVFTPEEAAAVRREGERVIAERLWITGWERWRPWRAAD